MRGLLDPAPWVENTERNPGVLLGALKQFPCQYMFSVVGRNEEGFVDDCVSTVAKVCQVSINPSTDVRVKERMGGRMVSVQIDAMVRAPAVVQQVFDKLGTDKRVVMKY
jgi:putative lipoic acid-binding regulatory protein